ncbi:hypothetical protein ANCCEY_13319 [Ancylostoma ceylanicum]|uniref:Uncharacterized protein n=1 Tax=Ancylostoma ceylanicum TaxID=53326 RepID=A0A0D6LCL7_9BILA|nr:hypothetical protein ANCCEY_13319 [Ancylostoma ceylanicum]
MKKRRLKINPVPASLNDRFVIRFCVCAENATDKDIETAYAIISQTAKHILHEGTSLPIAEEEEAEQFEEAGYEAKAGPVTNVENKYLLGRISCAMRHNSTFRKFELCPSF